MFSSTRARAALAFVAVIVALATQSVRGETLPRSQVLLTSAISVDAQRQTVTLPLHKGVAGTKSVWYVVTDSSDRADAKKRGLVFSPLLAQVGNGCAACVQDVTRTGDTVSFKGAPDFSPARTFTPSATGFPPAAAAPGASADASYSPFIRIKGQEIVYNAPIVATGNGPFDVTTHENTQERVLAIDTKARTVTMLLARGFAAGKPVLYFSTEASDPGAAAIERATYVPSLGKATAGKIAIYAFANGQTGTPNANAQGLAHAALDGKLDADATLANAASLQAPLNVLAYLPSSAPGSGFSPLWDANVVVWSKAAVDGKQNARQTDAGAIAQLASAGTITAPDGKPVHPVGFVVNCPVIAILP